MWWELIERGSKIQENNTSYEATPVYQPCL